MIRDNNTPFAAIGFEQWHRDGATMACIAVRGSYVFGEQGRIGLQEQQDMVLADIFEGDPHKTPLLKPGDLVPFKPSTDVTILGSVFAADGEAAPVLHGSIQINDFKAQLRACGPRHWAHAQDSWQLSEPEPITEVPLSYTLASGGRVIGEPDGLVDPRNPIGSNLIDPDFTPADKTYPAPQIDSEAHPISLDHKRPALPQGFGPMAPWWQARQRFAGTYDDAWKAQTEPRLPEDFDYRFYQCAHPNLILPDYLNGGDIVRLEGLTPNGQLQFRLPNIRPCAKFSFTDDREVTIALNLDGLHMDFRETPFRYDLTWRGWIEICPAFYRADLTCDTLDAVAALQLPVSCEQGLQEPV